MFTVTSSFVAAARDSLEITRVLRARPQRGWCINTDEQTKMTITAQTMVLYAFQNAIHDCKIGNHHHRPSIDSQYRTYTAIGEYTCFKGTPPITGHLYNFSGTHRRKCKHTMQRRQRRQEGIQLSSPTDNQTSVRLSPIGQNPSQPTHSALLGST